MTVALRLSTIVAPLTFGTLPIYWTVLVVLSQSGHTATWPPMLWPNLGALTLDGLRSADGPVRGWLSNSVRLAIFTTLAAISVYSFIIAWNDDIFARTFLPLGEHTTISVGATTLIGDFVLEWNAVMSVAVVATLPPLILFLCLQGAFVAGPVSGHD